MEPSLFIRADEVQSGDRLFWSRNEIVSDVRILTDEIVAIFFNTAGSDAVFVELPREHRLRICVR